MVSAMLLTLSGGGELVCVANPRQTGLILQTLHNEKITFYPGVPAMYVGIINHLRAAQDHGRQGLAPRAGRIRGFEIFVTGMV